MVRRFLSGTQYGYNVVTTSCSGKNRLQFIAIYRFISRFRVEVTDHLNIILTFTHHQVHRSRFSRLDGKESQLGQYAAVGQTSTGHHYIIAGIQYRSVLQQISPSSAATHINIAFIIIQQFQGSGRSQSGNREMRIILRVGQRLDRRISGNKLAGRRTGLFHRLKVHINSTFITHQLHFSGHFVYTCRNTHAACHGNKEDITAVRIGCTGLPHPFRSNRRTAQVAILVHTDIFGNPCNQLHRIGKVSLTLLFGHCFLKESFVRSNHFVAHTRITHKSAEIIGIGAQM